MTQENTSVDEIRKTVQHLCDFGQKVAGTEAEVQAANYLYDCLKGFGFSKVEKQAFDVHGWNPRSSTVKIIEPVQKEVESALFPYCKSESVEGPVVPIERREDDSSPDNKGLIAYADWGNDVYLSVRATYFRAVKLEYKGLIVAGPQDDLLKIVVIACGGLLKIPVVCITKEEGDSLRSMMDKGEVTVSIETDVEISEKSQSHNVVAILEGDGTSEHEIVVGAHYDSWFQGAADNCAPAATILELARLFHAKAKEGQLPKRTIRFLFYGAEESGSNDFYFWLVGSQAYVRDNQDSVAKTAAVLSLDSTGYTHPATDHIDATTDVLDFAKSLRADEGKVPSLTYGTPPSYGSDHWFFEISGVPTIYGVAFTSPLYHTQKDIPENLDFNAVHFYAEYMKKALLHLSSCNLLPIDIFAPLERFEQILSKYSGMEGNPVDLKPLVEEVKHLIKRRSSFRKLLASAEQDNNPEHLASINQFLLKAVYGFNRTIGFTTRPFETYTSDYLSRLEMIEDYVHLNKSITSLRQIPIATFDSVTVKRMESQSDNPYNWLRIHDSLANLEQERARIKNEIQDEIASLSELISNLMEEIDKIIDT
ncbi:MAG: Aminopeptidase YwaD precursor [Candidatus Thorarchaeota archaeon AB_25]|nr:MAG: Aminopeptidase YwaD precursor [Candidatus Thorarchaeota archaeon AB_25]